VVVHDAPEGKIKVVAYGVAGLANSGRGIFGGYPGAPSVIVLRERTRVDQWLGGGRYPSELSKTGGKARFLPYCDFDLRKGDILYMRQSSGGGYGDPLDRDTGMMERDVEDGMVSREVARNIYGVALNGRGGLDKKATQKLRGAMRKRRLRGKFLGMETGTDGASYPPLGVVELWEGKGRKTMRCARCKAELGKFGEAWKTGCRVMGLKPTEAGPLMKELVGHFLLRQSYCPSCGALLETSLAEKKNPPRSQNRAGRISPRGRTSRNSIKKSR
jgi:N-methylhydantoinase B